MKIQEQAERFASDWVAAWNSRNLERILALYTDDFEMSSPKIVHIAGEPLGKLRGKTAIGAYWKRALDQRPDLQFKLIGLLVGVDSICLYYESAPGHNAVEWFQFDDHLKVRKAAAHYAGSNPK